MVNEAVYAKTRRVTAPRLCAAMWVVAWVIAVHRTLGLPWAVRAVIFFQIPLAFIWLPDVLARIAGVARPRHPMPDGITPRWVVSFVGWLVLVATPVTWWLWWR